MHIADIPVEVFLDNLFPLAEVRDVLQRFPYLLAPAIDTLIADL
jgi:hypothetical protein